MIESNILSISATDTANSGITNNVKSIISVSNNENNEYVVKSNILTFIEYLN